MSEDVQATVLRLVGEEAIGGEVALKMDEEVRSPESDLGRTLEDLGFDIIEALLLIERVETTFGLAEGVLLDDLEADHLLEQQVTPAWLIERVQFHTTAVA